MKNFVLYASRKATPDHPQKLVVGGREIHIRIEEHAGSIMDAMEASLPKGGETVLAIIDER